MQVKIHELAAKELDDAVDWYDLQLKGLGNRFKKSVIHQINKVRNQPSWFLKEANDIFKVYVPKFPFKILYTIENEEVIVI